MPKVKTPPPAPAKRIPETLPEIADSLLQDHFKTVNAIVEDFVGGPGMELELEIAHDNLKRDIGDMLVDDDTTDALIKALSEKELSEEQFDAVMKIVEDSDEYSDEKVLGIVDEDEAINWASSKGYAYIKVDSLLMREKLEAFIKKELYPHVNEEKFYSV